MQRSHPALVRAEKKRTGPAEKHFGLKGFQDVCFQNQSDLTSDLKKYSNLKVLYLFEITPWDIFWECAECSAHIFRNVCLSAVCFLFFFTGVV